MAPTIGKDNIALEKRKQSALTKAVKKVVKGKGDIAKKPPAVKDKKGIIMLNHIPHGFYEKEMRGYFSQFGKVGRIKVARSKKTGKSRGYAFVEFEYEEVAKIAAEAMNNYLMFERLIKCELVADTVNAHKLFKNKGIREENFPKLKTRKRVRAAEDKELKEKETEEIQKMRVAKLEEQNKRFAEMGIEYKFPVGGGQGKVTPKKKDTLAQDKQTPKQGTPGQGKLTPKKKDTLVQDKQTPKQKTPGSAKVTPKQVPTPKKDKQTPKQKTPGSAKMTPSQDKQTPKMKTPGSVKMTPQQQLPTPKQDKATPKQKTPGSAKLTPLQDKATPKQNTPGSAKLTPQQMPTPKQDKQAPKQMTPVQGNMTPKQDMLTPKQKTPKLQSAPSSMEKKAKKAKSPMTEIICDDQTAPEEEPVKGRKRKASLMPKFSPKLLRSRKSNAPESKITMTTDDADDDGDFGVDDELPEMKPKNKQRKSLAVEGKKKTPEKNKFSPKLLRSRKSQGPVIMQDNEEVVKKTPGKKGKNKRSPDLPRISPKMLRNRKSDASALTPLAGKSAATPAKQKKGGRKSVF